jgi:hypothetical protein
VTAKVPPDDVPGCDQVSAVVARHVHGRLHDIFKTSTRGLKRHAQVRHHLFSLALDVPDADNGARPVHNRAPGPKGISNGGYVIDVPSNWRVVVNKSVSSINDCFSIKGPTVFEGSFTDLDGCLPISPTQTIVLFGSGGPPFSPIPDIYDGTKTFHDVTFQALIGADAVENASYLLALFPGRTTWLLMAARGASPQSALEKATQILATVHRAGGPLTIPPVHPVHESFIRYWEVHDASLHSRRTPPVRNRAQPIYSAHAWRPTTWRCRCPPTGPRWQQYSQKQRL